MITEELYMHHNSISIRVFFFNFFLSKKHVISLAIQLLPSLKIFLQLQVSKVIVGQTLATWFIFPGEKKLAMKDIMTQNC